MKGKKTKWNEKLMPYTGKIVLCSEFEKEGLDTEGYKINADGSLSFFNELRSLNAAMSLVTGEYKNHWNVKMKGAFRTAII